eukprot:4801610-Pyramimonas_sp.AAC.1
MATGGWRGAGEPNEGLHPGFTADRIATIPSCPRDSVELEGPRDGLHPGNTTDRFCYNHLLGH